MENTNEYKLEFILFDVTKSIFEKGTSERDYEFNIKVTQGDFDINDDESLFRSSFIIKIESQNAEKPLSILVQAGGLFKIHGSPPKDVADNFRYLSAPSIVYPYVRAYISNLSINSGINPVNIPSINFLDHFEKAVEKEDK